MWQPARTARGAGGETNAVLPNDRLPRSINETLL
jgi:hypothetical protein